MHFPALKLGGLVPNCILRSIDWGNSGGSEKNTQSLAVWFVHSILHDLQPQHIHAV